MLAAVLFNLADLLLRCVSGRISPNVTSKHAVRFSHESDSTLKTEWFLNPSTRDEADAMVLLDKHV